MTRSTVAPEFRSDADVDRTFRNLSALVGHPTSAPGRHAESQRPTGRASLLSASGVQDPGSLISPTHRQDAVNHRFGLPSHHESYPKPPSRRDESSFVLSHGRVLAIASFLVILALAAVAGIAGAVLAMTLGNAKLEAAVIVFVAVTFVFFLYGLVAVATRMRRYWES